MKIPPLVRPARLLAAIVLALVPSLHGADQTPAAAPRARNTILFIGDGLGFGLLSATRAYAVGADGRLQMERLSHTAFSRTCSEDRVVTDSAASASSLATGCKVPFHSLNVRGDGQRPALITELAQRAGRSVGIISNTHLTDATPAAFYGRAKNRHEEDPLVSQLVESRFQVVLGGGRARFLPKDTPPGSREDGQDMLAKAVARGWSVVRTREELKKSDALPDDARVLGVFADHDMAYVDERKGRPAEPTLAEMTLSAMRRLSKNPKGYFLMVEGGMMDKAGHMNWGARAIRETVDFDEAIGAAMKEAGKDTLIIVTADHETGGFALEGYPPITARGDDLLARQADQGFLVGWTSGPGALRKQRAEPLDPEFRQPSARYTGSAHHTATDVPIAATGPGSEDVRGFLDNTEIFRIIKRAMGL